MANTVQKLSSSSSFSCSSKPSVSSDSPYPITNFVSRERFSVRHINFLAAITAVHEPSSFREAVKDPGWREAMQAEIRALKDNGTWTTEKLLLEIS